MVFDSGQNIKKNCLVKQKCLVVTLNINNETKQTIEFCHN